MIHHAPCGDAGIIHIRATAWAKTQTFLLCVPIVFYLIVLRSLWFVSYAPRCPGVKNGKGNIETLGVMACAASDGLLGLSS
jgi:hypothetical protein